MNFSNGIAAIVTKSKRNEREMMWWKGERKKSDYGNVIAEIGKGKKKKKNCGNNIAEIEGEKKKWIVAMALPK